VPGRDLWQSRRGASYTKRVTSYNPTISARWCNAPCGVTETWMSRSTMPSYTTGRLAGRRNAAGLGRECFLRQPEGLAFCQESTGNDRAAKQRHCQCLVGRRSVRDSAATAPVGNRRGGSPEGGYRGRPRCSGRPTIRMKYNAAVRASPAGRSPYAQIPLRGVCVVSRCGSGAGTAAPIRSDSPRKQ